MLTALLVSLRPKQWIKNGFVFAALVFDGQLTNLPALLHTTLGFVLFCLASSSIYLINDIRDFEEDRHHPTKRNRPLPSGRLPISLAWAAAAVLAVVSIGGGSLLEPAFGGIVLAYVLLFVVYSFRLKHVPILDVFAIAAGFVLRVAGGVVLITVMRFSPWLYVCTTLLALYLGRPNSELGSRDKSRDRVLDANGTARSGTIVGLSSDVAEKPNAVRPTRILDMLA